MITLYKNLDKVHLAGNDITLRMLSGNQYSAQGSFSRTEFRLHMAPVNNNEAITLTWALGSVVITFKTTPDESGSQFKTLAPGGSTTAWLIDFTQFLNDHFALSPYFYAVYTPALPDRIYMHARKRGTDYSVTPSENLVNMTILTIAGTNRVPRDFFGFVLQVWSVETNGIDVMIGEDFITPSSVGIAEVSIAEYLKPYLKGYFKYPDSSDLIIQRPANSKAFYFKYAESWDATPQKVTRSAVSYALLGGISKQMEDWLAYMNRTWYTDLQVRMFFLTPSPDIKTTDTEAPERLFFLNTTTATTIRLYVFIKYTDGTTATVLLKSMDRIAQFMVYEFQTSYKHLPSSTKTVKEYHIFLTDQNDKRISAIKKYIPDYKTYPYKAYFMFRNSLGGFDTLICTGIKTNTNNLSRTTIQKDAETGMKAQSGNELSAAWQATTGSMNREYRDFISDFMLSPEIYWVRGGRLLKIINVSSADPAYDDDADRFIASFNFELAWNETHYSPVFDFAATGGSTTVISNPQNSVNND